MDQPLTCPLHTLPLWMSVAPGFVKTKVDSLSVSDMLPFNLSWLMIDCVICGYGIPETMCAGCHIIGVEITDSAQAVSTHPFHGNTAFMLGNEVSFCTPLHSLLS